MPSEALKFAVERFHGVLSFRYDTMGYQLSSVEARESNSIPSHGMLSQSEFKAVLSVRDLEDVLAYQMIENLKDSVEVGHARSVAIQEIGEHVLAVDEFLLGVLNFVGHFLQEVCLDS